MSEERYAAADVRQFHVRHDLPPMTWLVVILWPVIVALAAVYVLAPRAVHVGDLRADIAARPPVAIINREGSVLRAMGRDPSNESMKAATAKVDAAVQKLRAAGYVVLDAQNVDAYPPDFEAKP
ncbi:MAG: hypothetical protein ACYC9L_03140 [Sulfuricaulis sp.]